MALLTKERDRISDIHHSTEPAPKKPKSARKRPKKDESRYSMYGRPKTSRKKAGFNIFSFQDLYAKKEELGSKVQRLESEIDVLELEKDQVQHIAHRLKE